MADDEQLYHQMMTAFVDHIQRSQLKMLDHKYDTCLNEALNNSVAKYAPKTKCFSGSKSLEARVCIAMGTNIVGHVEFWKKVLAEMNIKMCGSLRLVLLKKIRVWLITQRGQVSQKIN